MWIANKNIVAGSFGEMYDKDEIGIKSNMINLSNKVSFGITKQAINDASIS